MVDRLLLQRIVWNGRKEAQVIKSAEGLYEEVSVTLGTVLIHVGERQERISRRKVVEVSNPALALCKETIVKSAGDLASRALKSRSPLRTLA